jgi:hypothetical protein
VIHRFQTANSYADINLRLKTTGADIAIATQNKAGLFCKTHCPPDGLCFSDNPSVCHCCIKGQQCNGSRAERNHLPLCTTCQTLMTDGGNAGKDGIFEKGVVAMMAPMVAIWGGELPQSTKRQITLGGISVSPDVTLVRFAKMFWAGDT